MNYVNMREVSMSCTCQECGKNYKVDLIISDELWEQIKPDNKDVGCGLLCGSCIMIKLEDIGEYNSYHLNFQSNIEYTCYNCNNQFAKKDIEAHNGVIYCYTCADSLIFCRGCGMNLEDHDEYYQNEEYCEDCL